MKMLLMWFVCLSLGFSCQQKQEDRLRMIKKKKTRYYKLVMSLQNSENYYGFTAALLQEIRELDREESKLKRELGP